MSVIVFITYFLQKQTSRNLQLNVFIVEILSLDMYIKLIRRKYIMKEYISCKLTQWMSAVSSDVGKPGTFHFWKTFFGK